MNKFISNKMIEYILKQGISHASNNRQTHRQDNAGLAQRRLGEEVAHDQGDGRHGNHEAPKLRHYPLTRIGNQFKWGFWTAGPARTVVLDDDLDS